MDEILQKLLSSELLSEDAKVEISTEWTKAVDDFKTIVREEESVKVRSEIAEQWASERDTLVENVETFVAKRLDAEIAELKSDIERFRDLEAEHAAKIVEEKHLMAVQLQEELDQLIDKMDAFFEIRLTEEFQELREDLEVVKQNEFGRKIFEAFATEFNKSHIDEDSTQSKLAKAQAQLEEAEQAFKELKESESKLIRESKMDRILGSLQGKKKEQMQFILANVETDRLEEAYSHFIGRVLKEEEQPEQVKPLKESVVITGEEQNVPAKEPVTDKFSHLKKLAGMTN